jgi:sugar phosphate isomerase/epimerase
LLNTVEVLNFVKKINHPFVQLNLDTGILTLNNEKIEQSIKQAFPFLTHFHISEPYLDLVNENGIIAHNKIAKILKKLKYKNYCSIEMKAFSSNNLRNIKRSLSFVSKIYG